MHGISVVVSQNVDLSALECSCREVPGTRRLQLITGMASTFQRGRSGPFDRLRTCVD